MPGPPPPPPNMPNLVGPPPPPMMNLNIVKKSGGSSSGADNRNALLSQIQKGTKLKKVQTVDKSGPIVAGRIADSNNKSSSSPRSQGSTAKNSPDSSTSSPSRPGGGFTNIADELQYKLTLKKKNSPLKEAKSIVETKESSPPSTTTTASSKSFLNEMKSKQSVISPQHQIQTSSVSTPPAPTPHIVNDAIPNKSSLFNNNINANNTISNNSNINRKSSSYENKSQPSAPKIINHGKPNLAPKPPPQLSLAINNNSNSSLNDSSRKAVARHQSMKSPRSPPVVPPMGPFNTENHFGTIRNPSSQNKTQEALNLQVVQKPIAQRPTNRPPPPPVPNRQVSTNLTSQTHAKSTTALNNTSNTSDQNSVRRMLPNSGSTNNISSLERNLDVADAPPPPPQRSSSAQKSQQLNISQGPPEVPRRNSSMIIKNNVEKSNNRYPSPNPNHHPPAPKLVVDLEARYSLLFHAMSELPPPKPFLNVPKSYPSKAVRPNGI